MTYLQSKPIQQPVMESNGNLMENNGNSPLTMSPGSSCESRTSLNEDSVSHCEDFLNKDLHQGIVDTMKKLQRGAKSITVTFSSIDR